MTNQWEQNNDVLDKQPKKQSYVLVFYATRDTVRYNNLAALPTLSIEVPTTHRFMKLNDATDLINCNPLQVKIDWPQFVTNDPNLWDDLAKKYVKSIIDRYKHNIDGCWIIKREDFDKLQTKDDYGSVVNINGSYDHSESAAYQLLNVLYSNYAIRELIPHNYIERR